MKIDYNFKNIDLNKALKETMYVYLNKGIMMKNKKPILKLSNFILLWSIILIFIFILIFFKVITEPFDYLYNMFFLLIFVLAYFYIYLAYLKKSNHFKSGTFSFEKDMFQDCSDGITIGFKKSNIDIVIIGKEFVYIFIKNNLSLVVPAEYKDSIIDLLKTSDVKIKYFKK